jgi:hypothetical protein
MTHAPICTENPVVGAGQYQDRPVTMADSVPSWGDWDLQANPWMRGTHASRTPSGRFIYVYMDTYMCVLNTQNRTIGFNPFVGLLYIQDY